MWIVGATHLDYSSFKGNGPFRDFRGVILHVNVDEHGTSDAFFRAGPPTNPDEVCPNFQVYKDGTVHQYLPLNWQPWCQADGNYNYAAIETAGLPSEPLTPEQLAACSRIVAAYHDLGMPLALANEPGQRGLGTHAMGGAAWGGHACPGTIRSEQRHLILSGVRPGHAPSPRPVPHLRRRWPAYMRPGNYFGLITGPNESHGGYYKDEQPDVRAIQSRLHALGYNPGTADGRFGWATYRAVSEWQHRHYAPQTQFYGQVWSDDWRRLFTW